MREYSLILTALILLSKSAFARDKEMVEKVASGEVQTAKASWWGFEAEDSTDALQAAINSGAKKLIVDNTGKPWVVRPIKLASNQQIIFESGVEVVAKPGEFKGKGDCLFRSAGGKNIALIGYGATLRMRRAEYAGAGYEKSEWRHLLSFCSCSNISILGLTIAESGGDGIYLGTATKGVTNSNVVIKDVVCDKHYRQGISVITAENLLVENTIMRGTAGTDPQSGIDFEPNQPSERLANIVLRNCVTERNSGSGYMFYLKFLSSESAPVSVRFEKCSSTGDIVASARIANGNPPKEAVTGKIEFIGCTFKDSANAGVLVSDVPVTGCKVRFVDCSILDAAAGKPASAPIVFQSRRGAAQPIGGVEFVNCTVRDSLDRNPLAYIDGGSTAGMRDVGGTINLERNGVRQTIKLAPELLEQWFAASRGLSR